MVFQQEAEGGLVLQLVVAVVVADRAFLYPDLLRERWARPVSLLLHFAAAVAEFYHEISTFTWLKTLGTHTVPRRSLYSRPNWCGKSAILPNECIHEPISRQERFFLSFLHTDEIDFAQTPSLGQLQNWSERLRHDFHMNYRVYRGHHCILEISYHHVSIITSQQIRLDTHKHVR